MIIGILSDTHNNISAALKAAELFLEYDTSHVLHCGDIGTTQVVSVMTAKLIPTDIQLHITLGNCDLYSGIATQLPRMGGVTFHGRFGQLKLAKKNIVFYHGDEQPKGNQWSNPSCDYVFTGHTHIRKDQRIGRARHINPGALRNTNRPSIALLHLERDKLTFIDM